MGRSYFLITDGFLSRKEDTIFFKNSEIEKVLPIEDVDEIFVLSEISLTSKLLKLLAKKGIPLHLFNRYGFYVGSFYPRETHTSGFLIVKQVQHYLDMDKRLYLAKAFVVGAIENLSAVYKIDNKHTLDRLKKAKTIEEIMSIEGNFRKVCYEELGKKTSITFEGRTKRPPQDPINALISLGNSLTYAKVLGEIYFTPLNPTISYLHEPSTKRFSLSLDVAEVFKPIFSDALILRLLKEGKIKEKHFKNFGEGVYLNDEGRKIYVSEFKNLLEKTIYHKKLKRKISYRQLIRIELFKLIKHFLDEEPYKPYIRGW